MSEEYKTLITGKIKDSINEWIEKLKSDHPELLLTRQWQPLFPKGFRPGQVVIPVVTGSKQGQYLVAEIRFYLPDSLELDSDALELLLKNEPFSETKAQDKISPPPLDEPLTVINEIVSGLNHFLQSLALPAVSSSGDKPSIFSSPLTAANPIRVTPVTGKPLIPHSADEKEEIIKQMLNNPHLPDWFKTIYSPEVRRELIDKLADGFIHYRRQLGRPVDFKEFFDSYTEHLKKQNKLHLFCPYKSKPVVFDINNHCTENYCSKKPFNAPCPVAKLKFGAAPET